MSTLQLRQARDGAESIGIGVENLLALFMAIKRAARDTQSQCDGDSDVRPRGLEMIARLAALGMDSSCSLSDRAFDLGSSIDDLVDEPQVDMMQSAQQAHTIQQAMVALLQVVPEDQPDLAGAVRTVYRLALDLSTHLASGGKFVYPKVSTTATDGGEA